MGAIESKDEFNSPGRILLADDEPTLRRALARRLRSDGHEVIEAETGARALELLAERDVEVVLTDIMMPDMDGVELLRRARGCKPGVPVLLMTGAPEIATAVKAVEYGAFEYLTKPFELAQLARSVSRALQQHRAALEQRRVLDSAVRAKNNASGPRRSDGSLPPGTLLAGRYRIVGLIGSGGMGSVYEAEREDLGGMRVALKVLHPKLSGRPELLQRFRREAELVAKLSQPNIVKIFDFVSDDEGLTFLVMELLQGRTLADAIRNDPPISEARIAFIASQVLDALEAAHAIDVVHRDVKPENVLLTTISGIPDVVKLLDFGIAKPLSDDAGTKLTETGTVLGTPAYMAPEYARGERVDALCDIYALGCVMYESIARRLPFGAANYNALIFAIQGKEPEPLRAARPDVSAELAALIARAMAKTPAERFRSAREMHDALSPWLAIAPSTRSAPSPIESAPTEELHDTPYTKR